MKPDTNTLLFEFEEMDWFFNIGRAFDSDADVQRIDDWLQAMEVCCAQSSDDARLEASNELTVLLSNNHKDAYRSWNSKIDELKPLVEKLVREKLATPSVRSRIPGVPAKAFIGALNWDLLALSMASEYKNMVCTKYYELLEYWYLAGHFPCGWIGEVPDDMEGAFFIGKLAVI